MELPFRTTRMDRDATLDSLCSAFRSLRADGLTNASYRPIPSLAEDPATECTEGAGAEPPPTAPVEPPAAGFVPVGLLGQGGMGEVYRAHQPSLDREVALKRVRGDAPHARRALATEALITGRLEHPNIVPVYDFTHAEAGPSIAMKLVGGTSWFHLLRQNQDLRTALEVLRKVCDAVAFAHSRNIVHNDLKPSNVMVGAFGEVLLMDWGLACAIGPPETRSRLRHKSAITSPCGTPCYVPPELARGDGAAIGPGTDIYLLGAILYRLLCGHPPHRGKLEQAIESALAPHPPALPAEVCAAYPLLAEACLRALAPEPRERFAAVEDFQQALRDHLEHRESIAIARRAEELLSTCVEGSSERLYEDFSEAVHDFAAARKLWAGNRAAAAGESRAREAWARAALRQGDIGLASAQLARLEEAEGAPALREQVLRAGQRQAAEASTRRRLRNGLLVSLTLLFLGLAGGLAWVQMANMQIAEQNETILAERAAAEEAAHIAFDVLETMSADATYALEQRLGDPNAAQARKEIVATTKGAWERLARSLQRADSGSLLTARALAQLGQVRHDDSLPELRASARIAGELEGPAARRQEAVALALLAGHELQADDPAWRATVPRAQASLIALGDLDLATRRSLAFAWERIGLQLRDVGALTQAARAYENAIALRELHTIEDRELKLQALMARGQISLAGGDFDAATGWVKKALKIGRSAVDLDPSSAAALSLLCMATGEASDLFALRGELSMALDYAERAVELGSEALALDGTSVPARRRLAKARIDLGRLLDRAGRPEHAERSLRLAQDLLQPLYARFPDEFQLRFAYSDVLENRARLARGRRDDRTAESLLVMCIDLRAASVAENPQSATAQDELASACIQLARLYADGGDLERARGMYRTAIETLEMIIAAQPGVLHFHLELVDAELQLAYALASSGDPSAARAGAQRATARLRAVRASHGVTTDLRRRLARVLIYLAQISDHAGDQDAARAAFEEAIDELRQGIEDEPDDVGMRRDIAGCMLRLALLSPRLEDRRYLLEMSLAHNLALREPAPQTFDPNEARYCCEQLLALTADDAEVLAYTRQAAELATLHAARDPSPAPLADATRLNLRAGDLLFDRGDFAAAADHYAHARESAQRAHEALPDNPLIATHLVKARWRHFEAELARGESSAARASLEELHALLLELVPRNPDFEDELRAVEQARATLFD